MENRRPVTCIASGAVAYFGNLLHGKQNLYPEIVGAFRDVLRTFLVPQIKVLSGQKL